MADEFKDGLELETAVGSDIGFEVYLDGDNALDIEVESSGGAGAGAPGGYYKPSVDEDGVLSWEPSKEDMPKVEPYQLPSGGTGELKIGDSLKYDEHGNLVVNTTEDIEPDNTLPVTSSAVAVELGNINVLLSII